ncbi:MAG: zinc-ribbon domain-containing protein [Deltaproteobacteria bacterium]|nr:zinc-ribbon domain-containing protein [Deltaproteobacteria bacterium]
MDVVCTKCHSRFKIPDEKVPEGTAASFTCPKCKSRVAFDLRKQPPEEGMVDQEDTVSYDASETPFNLLETESRTALICETDEALKKMLAATAQAVGYQVTDAPNTKTAVKKIWYHVYDLIIIGEQFDLTDTGQNRTLAYLQQLNMTVRRQNLVVMITRKTRTMDQMAAFKASVNLVINVKDLRDLNRIVDHGANTHETLYRVYKECLRKEFNV